MERNNLKEWQVHHWDIIKGFLEYLNGLTDDYVLKGGTALLECYGLNRFSEDIDLEGFSPGIEAIVSGFCNKQGIDYRVGKDTNTVKRFLLHYGGVKPLKVEVSYRSKYKEGHVYIGNILTYSIEKLAVLKTQAYTNRDKIRDLYDVVFIGLHYWEQLSPTAKTILRTSLEYKGIDYYEYITTTQKDELIDDQKLGNNLLELMDRLGLLY